MIRVRPILNLVVSSFLPVLLLLVTLSSRASAFGFQTAIPLGGVGGDNAVTVDIDSNGNVYVAGFFESSMTVGATTLVSVGNVDGFIFKLDADGNIVWAKQFGNVDADAVNALRVDTSGNIYVTGRITGNVAFGAITLTTVVVTPVNRCFVAKLDTNGNWLWAKDATPSGGRPSSGRTLAVDASGSAYVAGSFNIQVGFGATTLNVASNDSFLAKLDANGNWLWAMVPTTGSGEIGILGLAFGDGSYIYLTGNFRGSVTFGTTTFTSTFVSYRGSYTENAFVSKIDLNGNYVWTATNSGDGGGSVTAVAVDTNGNALATGYFGGTYCSTLTNPPSTSTFGATTLTAAFDSGNPCISGNDAFVAKLDTNGNWLWVTQGGGTGTDYEFGIALDQNDEPWVAGSFQGSATFGSINKVSGNQSASVAHLDGNGNWLSVWDAPGNTGLAAGQSVAVNSSGAVAAAGLYTQSATFGLTTLTSAGGQDGFVTVLSEPPPPPPPLPLAYPGPLLTGLLIAWVIVRNLRRARC